MKKTKRLVRRQFRRCGYTPPGGKRTAEKLKEPSRSRPDKREEIGPERKEIRQALETIEKVHMTKRMRTGTDHRTDDSGYEMDEKELVPTIRQTDQF